MKFGGSPAGKPTGLYPPDPYYDDRMRLSSDVCVATHGLVKGLRPKQITLTIEAIKHFVNVRVADRAVFRVRQEILLANVGGVIAV